MIMQRKKIFSQVVILVFLRDTHTTTEWQEREISYDQIITKLYTLQLNQFPIRRNKQIEKN